MRKLIEVEVAEARRVQKLENNYTSFIDNVVKKRITAKFKSPSNYSQIQALISSISNFSSIRDANLTYDDIVSTSSRRESAQGHVYIMTREHRGVFQRVTYDNILLSLRSGLISGELTVDELTRRGNGKMQRNNIQAALTFYTIAIDQLQSECMIYLMNQGTQTKFANLLAKRAKCNLKIGELRQSKDLFSLAERDARFVLFDQVFGKKFFETNTLLVESLRQISAQAIKLIKEIEDRENEEANDKLKNQIPVVNREEVKVISHKIDVILNTNLESGEYELKYKSDSCMACLNAWSELNDPSVIIVLPCSHAVCAGCLYNLQKKCLVKIEETNEFIAFSCPECRFKLRNSIVKEVARLVVKNNVVDSITEMSKLLHVNASLRKELLETWLVSKSFIAWANDTTIKKKFTPPSSI